MISKKNFESSVAKSVRKAIESKPSVVDCLKNDVINYSGLARLLSKELGVKNNAAIVSAIKRHKQTLDFFNHDKTTRKLVGESTIEMKSDVAIITLPRNFDWEPLQKKMKIHHVVEGPNYTNIVVDERELEKGDVAKIAGVEVRRNLAAITLRSTPQFVSTPGAMMHFLQPIAFAGINMEEVLSCYTDKIILVKLQDANNAFNALNELINDARREK